ncbi:unnamed protein product [Caenorhabditis bovis]|uniref:RBR-type E3 ubiquitin transferase n=1 Tax=Caenorhabditis bovis TaxID=2654633 RepID=A0A8S1EEQ6_9PELO|nr:unnamed protein product [Caenorhabditis bovis]
MAASRRRRHNDSSAEDEDLEPPRQRLLYGPDVNDPEGETNDWYRIHDPDKYVVQMVDLEVKAPHILKNKLNCPLMIRNSMEKEYIKFANEMSYILSPKELMAAEKEIRFWMRKKFADCISSKLIQPVNIKAEHWLLGSAAHQDLRSSLHYNPLLDENRFSLRKGLDVKISEKHSLIFNEKIPEDKTAIEYYRTKFPKAIAVNHLNHVNAHRFLTTIPIYQKHEICMGSLYELFFESKKDMQKAIRDSTKYFKTDLNFSIGTIDYEGKMESFQLEFAYEYGLIPTDSVILKVARVEDLEVTVRILEHHKMTVQLLDDRDRDETMDCCQFRFGMTTMKVSEIPSHLNNEKAAEWLIGRILDLNKVQWMNIQLLRHSSSNEHVDLAIGNPIEAINAILIHNFLFDLRLQKMIEKFQVESLQEYDDNGSLPWKIVELESPSDLPVNVRQLRFRVLFDMARINSYVRKLNNRGDMRNFLQTLRKHLPPSFVKMSIYPRYRLMIPIARNVRIAMNTEIEEMNSAIKRSILREDSLRKGEYGESSAVRIIDDFNETDDDGLIGLEGWSKELVESIFPIFKDLLTPLLVNAEKEETEELLQGTGLAWLRHVENVLFKNIVIDVNNFKKSYSIYGNEESVKACREALKSFNTRKEIITISAKIPIQSPTFNNEIWHILDMQFIQILSEQLKSSITVDAENTDVLEFKGSYASYDLLMKIIKEIDTMVFHRLISNFPALSEVSICPVCTNEVDENHVQMESCGHVYCRKCFDQLINRSILNIGEPARCFATQCHDQISSGDILRTFVDLPIRVNVHVVTKLRPVYQAVLKRWNVGTNSCLKLCPTSNCYGILGQQGAAERSEICYVCQQGYCNECGQRAHDKTCAIFRSGLTLLHDNLSRFGDKRPPGSVKPCPNCRTYIQKIKGCHHIQCVSCKVHFCWICRFKSINATEVHIHLKSTHGSYGYSDYGVLIKLAQQMAMLEQNQGA